MLAFQRGVLPLSLSPVEAVRSYCSSLVTLPTHEYFHRLTLARRDLKKGKLERFRAVLRIAFTTDAAYAVESAEMYFAIASRSSTARGDHATR